MRRSDDVGHPKVDSKGRPAGSRARDTSSTRGDKHVRPSRRWSVGFVLCATSLGFLTLNVSAGATPAVPNGTSTPLAATSADRSADIAAKKKPPKKRMGVVRSNNHVDPVRPAAGANAVTLPASVDLRAWAVPVQNQGTIGSCVAWTIDYALLGWYSRHDGKAGQPFHPMYTYSQIHGPEPPGGTTPKKALDIALNQGTDTMAHYSRSTTDYSNLPTASERTNAANFKISQYQALFDNNQPGGTAGAAMIQTALAKGQPVAISMGLRTSFSATSFYNKTSLASATYSDTTTRITGYHEILALGYDQTGLWIQNSWGTAWGYQGYARLSWPVVERDVLTAYTISGFASGTGPVDTKDTTPPTMGAVNQQFALNQQITSTTQPVTFSWSASDASGVAQYGVFVKTDAGQFAYQAAVPATATQHTFALSTGHTYQVAVAAKDGVGNWSAHSFSTTVRPTLVDDGGFTVSSPWERHSELVDTIGGTYIGTSAVGAWVQTTFIGTDAAVIAVKGTNAGRASVYCDGTRSAVGDFYSASIITRQIVAYCHFPQQGQHTMQITNEGTSGRPFLFFDAFVSLE